MNTAFDQLTRVINAHKDHESSGLSAFDPILLMAAGNGDPDGIEERLRAFLDDLDQKPLSDALRQDIQPIAATIAGAPSFAFDAKAQAVARHKAMVRGHFGTTGMDYPEEEQRAEDADKGWNDLSFDDAPDDEEPLEDAPLPSQVAALIQVGIKTAAVSLNRPDFIHGLMAAFHTASDDSQPTLAMATCLDAQADAVRIVVAFLAADESFARKVAGSGTAPIVQEKLPKAIAAIHEALNRGASPSSAILASVIHHL